MRVWRWVLLLIVVAALAAAGWHWIAVDPGYVLVRLRGWRVETTLVTAVLLLLLLWFVITLLWRLVHWPFGAVTRRHRRTSRKRFTEGMLALAEGRHAEAERALGRAARHAPLRGPALLATSEAAARRGDMPAALQALDRTVTVAPQAARVQRASLLRRDGRAGDAVTLLASEADAGALSPAGWRELVLAALDCHDARRARASLEPLRKSGAMDPKTFATVQNRVLVLALQQAVDAAALDAMWSELPRAQRRVPAAVDAYARRSAHFGRLMPAMDEVESTLRRQWSGELAETWGALEGGDVEPRLRRAEIWLDKHPADAGLLITLGRLCARLQLWGKAREYLTRALATTPEPAAWEVLGDVYVGQGNAMLAQQCYRNALRLTRHEPTEPLPGEHAVERDMHPDVEQRSEHGVPHLPDEKQDARTES